MMCGIQSPVQAQDNNIYTFTEIDKKPVFNGKTGSVEDYIIDHYRRPAGAPEEVEMDIAFVVEKNGKLSNIEIKGLERITSKGVEERPVPPSVKKEVMRILTAMPAWTPATKNGKAVRYKEETYVNAMDRETKAKEAREKAKEAREKAKEAREMAEARDKKIRESKANGKVYEDVYVDTRPFFPGGDAALISWIKANIKYPAKAKEKGVTGRVVVTFIVEIDGSLSDIKIIRNTAPEFKAEFEAEAIRLVKAMPAWDPAKIIIERTIIDRTEDVRYRYTCPIVFI
jgi:TonB family protein